MAVCATCGTSYSVLRTTGRWNFCSKRCARGFALAAVDDVKRLGLAREFVRRVLDFNVSQRGPLDDLADLNPLFDAVGVLDAVCASVGLPLEIGYGSTGV